MFAIVAADENWGIGKDGSLLVRIPADLKRFQALTMGHPVILGRKTLSTFPGGKPLPGRKNLVLSRNPEFCPEGCAVFRDLDGLLSAAPKDSFVIGGGDVYRQLLPWCETVYVTRLSRRFPADSFFPDLDRDPDWIRVNSAAPLSHDGLEFRYDTYQKKPRQ